MNKITIITAILCLIIYSMTSCNKLQCYKCYTTKFDGSPQKKNPEILCGMTEKGIRKFEKSKTVQINPDSISPNDIIVTCELH